MPVGLSFFCKCYTMKVENFVLVFFLRPVPRQEVRSWHSLQLLMLRGYHLITAIQRFNQLSLQNLSLVSIHRKFGYFTFVCELVDRENWKGGYDPKNKPKLSEMSYNDVCLRVVSLLIDAYGQNLFRGSSCLSITYRESIFQSQVLNS